MFPTIAKNIKELLYITKRKTPIWIVRVLNHKETDLQKELKEIKIDIATIPEPRKKLRGTTVLDEHFLL